MNTLNCQYFNPLNGQGLYPQEGEFFQFSEMDCDFSIENATNTEKYVSGFSYGDSMLIFLCLGIMILMLFNKIYDRF